MTCLARGPFPYMFPRPKQHAKKLAPVLITPLLSNSNGFYNHSGILILTPSVASISWHPDPDSVPATNVQFPILCSCPYNVYLWKQKKKYNNNKNIHCKH